MPIYGVSGQNNNQYMDMSHLIRLSGMQSRSPYTAIPPIQKTTPVTSGKTAYEDTIAFLKTYESELASLESASAKLQEGSRNNLFKQFEAASTAEDVAVVSGTGRQNEKTDMTLDVQSLAQAQKNVSKSHYAQEHVEAGADMNFEISGSGGNASISISSMNENGTAKTYNQMYQDAAKAINANSQSGVKASVSNTDGKVSLVLTAKDTGEDNGFTVRGSTGSAEGLETAATEAQDAVYTVTRNGYSQTETSQSNKISLDYGRIEAELKAEGTTRVHTRIDPEKVVDAVEDLVDSYNSVTNLLRKNEDRGVGTASQLSAFSRGMAADKTLETLGITYNKDGNLELDKEKLMSALSGDFEGTKELISGQFGIAQKAGDRAGSAMSDSVQRTVSNDLLTGINQSQSTDSSNFRYFSDFARSGPYNLGNYYTVGLMFNSLV